MLEMNFENTACDCEKVDPIEETSAQLLPAMPAEDANREQEEINSNARSKKARPAESLCYNINTYLLFTLATLLAVCAVLMLRWPLFDFLTTERLRMLPSFPPFKLWVKPEPIVYCKAYIFTVTNAEAFLNGTDEKMRVKELGPVIFREHLEHTDVVFHDNSTMSYTIRRYLEFLPDMNEPGILNQTVVVPNIVLLGMVTKVADYPFTARIAFNLISREDRIFENKTIYEYFFNYTTPALLTVDKYLPFLVPQDNGGTLYSIYKDFTHRVNVNIGPKYSAQEFFMINTFDHRPTVPGFRPERGDCYADLMHSSEGAIYPNRVEKDVVLYYWRKTACRPIPLHFQEEVDIGWLKGYKYIAREDLYDRISNLTADCYKGLGGTPLPDGLSDVSKCYSDLPIAMSIPHFYGRSGYWEDKVEGYTPDYEAHTSYAIIEPINGVPLEQRARSQSNMIMPRLHGFNHKVNRFSEMVVPIIWVEYHQPALTTEIIALLVFTSNILPRIQYLMPVIFLALALLFYFFVLRRVNKDFSLGGYSRIKLLWQRERDNFFDKKA